MYLRIITLVTLICSVSQAFSQVYINEYSASNLDNIKDSFNKTEDWLEIYNASNQDIDISGWYLSDKEDSIDKWLIPQGTLLPANGFLTFFCSGKDGLYNGEYHTNFKLTQTSGDDVLVIADAQQTIVDQAALSLTLAEHSNCRLTDGADEWAVSTAPSFGLSNNTTPNFKGYTNEPSMSLDAGFYNNEITVELTNNESNSTLRYTIDGSNPLPNSPIYTDPINISETTVIKARAYSNDNNILPGKIQFNTFFINESFTLPVFSVAADRVVELAGGIGELLPEGSLEYFRDGELQSRSFGELNRHGQDSWVLPHRSIDWISRDEMGYSKDIDSDIFSSSDRDSYQRFMFRNSGDDNYPAINDFDHEGSTHVRDEYVQTLAQEGNMKLDVRKVERVIVFLNGQYWGVYGMREKVVDHDYTDYYYNQGKEDVQFLSTWGDTEIEYGGQKALREWIDIRDFILQNDMSTAANYKIAQDTIDMVSLIDYFVMNQATVASDWLIYNTGWWRGLAENGGQKKWGYILWDLDATFDYYINYTGIPDVSPQASFCDIYEVSTQTDFFFDGFFGNVCDYYGGNNSPYEDNDPTFQQVVNFHPECCSDWTMECQGFYDDPSTIQTEVIIEDCPIIVNGTSPYPADDPILAQVIEFLPGCCNEWGAFCQDTYNFLDNTVDVESCPIIVDGTSPYPADDPILEDVIRFFPECCDEWTPFCENWYQDFSTNGGNNASDCPAAQDPNFAYDPADPKVAFVIDLNPDCCDEWGFSCDRDYRLLGGDQFAEPDDPATTGILGNIGGHEKILLKLFEESPEFNQLYYSRYADLMNTVFTCENMIELLDRMIEKIAPEMPRQIERWGGTMNEWESNVDQLRNFIADRCEFLGDGAMECYGEIQGTYSVTLVSDPPGVGDLTFNTISHNILPWTGDYFGDMDNLANASVKDVFANQYVFSHWESKNGNDIQPNVDSPNMMYRLSMPDTLVAHFKLEGSGGNMDGLVINEFMASNNVTVADQDGEFDDWIELYNGSASTIDLSGYFLTDNDENLDKFEFPDGTSIRPDDYLIIWADEDGEQEGLHANFKLSRSGEAISLLNPDTLVIDRIEYAEQETDVSFARKPNGTGLFELSTPTFNQNNDISTSVTENDFVSDRLVTFPNPTSHSLTVQFKTNGHLIEKLRITDVMGREVMLLNQLNDRQHKLDVSSLTPGLYTVMANDKFVSKVIIQ